MNFFDVVLGVYLFGLLSYPVVFFFIVKEDGELYLGEFVMFFVPFLNLAASIVGLCVLMQDWDLSMKKVLWKRKPKKVNVDGEAWPLG